MIKQIAFALIVLATSCSSQQAATNNTSNQGTRSQRNGQESRPSGPPSVDEIFKMDINGDGLLAKTEVKGKLLEIFDTVDTNQDGFISKEELENMPKPQRGQGGPRPKN